MARSRSSFDIDGAVATAAALVKRPKGRPARAASVTPAAPPLVSFASRPPPAPAEPDPLSPAPLSPAFEELAPSSDLMPLSSPGAGGDLGLRSALPPSAEDVDSRRGVRLDLPSPASSPSFGAPTSSPLFASPALGAPASSPSFGAPGSPSFGAPVSFASPVSSAFASPVSSPVASDAEPLGQRLGDAVRELASGRASPRFPDLSAPAGPLARCDKVIEWLAEVTSATDVFLADAAGLPIAGAIRDTEARLAASGLIASAIGSLVAALPGAPSQRFELCVGDGPFFQLVGFQVSAAVYIVGLMRPVPLTPREAHAVRIVCRHALDAAAGVVG
ncbi:hypothetical protein WMF31_05985 [Sorangium sp. So ce1036]|uniref:hypothetical protein n=1 Tax=Sorangium sp. So ce1036 TaxID=3133328 RepID=UPI003EFEC78F